MFPCHCHLFSTALIILSLLHATFVILSQICNTCHPHSKGCIGSILIVHSKGCIGLVPCLYYSVSVCFMIHNSALHFLLISFTFTIRFLNLLLHLYTGISCFKCKDSTFLRLLFSTYAKLVSFCHQWLPSKYNIMNKLSTHRTKLNVTFE